ncbi:Glycosyltransferase involved in cell wall bisynthesis [Xylanibacter ruminicola]|uniref:Glycosyltransferase involved in cell wall bisynthesis n=1 Tax=Xylanibacter ruminicola TaxID=839 RepID=A0A1H4C4L3_XYLRU|nr:glycosyltransferase [Xylanibacter ruminicola]SEA55280.1 Glycosyltransferase involved in cell wall bisynthesis [Xylanibacter ruminicola]
MDKNTVFVQNIISPYRNRFFNMLNNYSDNFSVFYMDNTEPDRSWDTSKLERKYSNWVDNKGAFFQIGSYRAHFNPVLIWKILTNKNIKNVILAVAWQDPNIMLLCFAKKLHLTSKRFFFWAEANYTAEWTKKNNTKLKWILKRSVFNSIDGALIIPGRMSEITFEKWNIGGRHYIHLPNTIDDSDLRYDSTKRVDEQLPSFIMPIRVIERVKGGLNFFKSIGIDNIRKVRFIVAGDGEDMSLYKKYIEENKLEGHIIMAGFCDSKRMSELYNSVNALVLPSFSDPSPLSLVEALYFHLPILCSNHCGNHFEAVKEGSNGLTFSPLEPLEIKKKFEEFLSLRSSWTTMGEVSSKIYKEVFDTGKVVRSFLRSFDERKKI